MRDASVDLTRPSKCRDKSLVRAAFSAVFGNLHFSPGFDKTLTPGQLTPLLTPLLTHYKINGKMNPAYLSLNNPF